MKALIVGGAGFIGSHLCDALAKQGHDVVQQLEGGVSREIRKIRDLLFMRQMPPTGKYLTASLSWKNRIMCSIWPQILIYRPARPILMWSTRTHIPQLFGYYPVCASTA